MKLKSYLADADTTIEAFAAKLDVSEHAVRKWVYGQRIPGPDIMRRIHEATGGAVTANDFYELPTSDEAA